MGVISKAKNLVELRVEVVPEIRILTLHIVNILTPVIEEHEAIEAFFTSLKLILSILTTSHLKGPCRLVAEVEADRDRIFLGKEVTPISIWVLQLCG